MMYRVYNDNVHELKDYFQGKPIVLAPGEFIELNKDEMHLYVGQFKAPAFLGSGQPDPRSFKKLRVEPVDGSSSEVTTKANQTSDKDVCQACGFVAKNKAGLAAHIRHNHSHLMLDDDAKKELLEHGSK